MANITVTTNQQVIDVTTTGGVNVTNTTDTITVLPSGTLIIQSPDTYSINAGTATGGANLNLLNSNGTNDAVKIASGTGITVSRTDADTITVTNTSPAGTTYTQNASLTTGGANLNLVGSDSTTDSIKLASGTNVTVTRTDADTVTFSSTDTNTTYTQNFSSTSGGTNLNLVGSDSTTDTVKFASGTGVTVAYTDADTATISIGQDVATTANPTFAGGTLGNITVGVSTDNTITTTTSDLLLNSATGVVKTVGDITIGGNDIKSSDGTTALSLADSTGNVTVAGDLFVAGNDILSNGGFNNINFPASSSNVKIIGDLIVGGNDIQASDGNTAITLSPITSFNPNVDFPGNIIKGAIRSSSSESSGDIWTLGGVGYTGITVDNTDKVTDRTALVMRNYGGSLASGNPRVAIVSEAARGTAASPTNITSGLFLFDISVGGYTSTGWTSDLANTNPLLIRGVSTEAWSSGTSNTGVGFQVFAQPTATTLTTTSQTPILNLNPQAAIHRSDSFTFRQGKTGTADIMTLDVNGNAVITGNATTNGKLTALGTATFNTDLVVDAQANLLNTNTSAGATLAIQTNYRASSGGTLSVPQSGWKLGNFRWNSYSTTGGAYVLGAQLSVNATENFTSTANGTSISLFANKQGQSWTTGHTGVATFSPETANIMSDTFTLESSAGTDYAVLSANTAKFNVPVTTEITSATVLEGTTYTPAATVDNNISVQLNVNGGGTTVIDLASLTGNTRGASYNILVFNNTGSGAAIQVKNTRISSGNLMTHTITTGAPRIIINAYVVGDYATATHFVVA